MRVRFQRRRDGFQFKCQADRFFRWRLRTQGQPGAENVFLVSGSKVKFVVPLDLRHFQKAVEQVNPAAVPRITRGGFVFFDVSALKLSRAVHGRQPAREVAQETQSAANDRGADLAASARSGAQTRAHPPSYSSLPPLLVFDFPY